MLSDSYPHSNMANTSGDLISDLNQTVSLARKVARQPKTVYYRLLEARLNSLVKRNITDKFLAYFPEQIEKYGPNSHKPFIGAVSFLKDSCQKIETSLSNLGQNQLRETLLFVIKTQILSAKPYYLEDYIESTYLRAFRAYVTLESRRSRGEGDDSMECDVNNISEEFGTNDFAEFDDFSRSHETSNPSQHHQSEGFCQGCSLLLARCDCDSIFEQFRKMNDDLRQLKLLEILAGDAIMTVARTVIERRVATKGKSNYDCSYLQELSTWVTEVVRGWFLGIYRKNELKVISSSLDQFLRDAYSEIRVSHMFEIIVDYPNSEAAIQDLKLCIEQSTSPSFRLNLIDSVKQYLVESLLHPGVNTYDILAAYISAIKALRALDPSGLILQLVTEPVRRYLKSRNDTVRCIVTALTDEDHSSELNREMIRSTQTNENGICGKSETIEMNLPNEGEKCTASNFEKWRPDPIKLSSSDDVMKTSRFSDIVSILVNIYETKDLFVEEYQKLLSQRLLNKYDECNLDTELRNLELLTLRFSDCELHRCEVMLKDVQISKRVNKRIISGDIKDQKLTGFQDLNVLIVSSPFWPEKFGPIAALSEEPPNISFPEEIQSAMNTYTKAFEAIQASRTLHWRHHLGFVNMDVTINGKVQNFTVSPLHAALLYMFQNKRTWKLDEIIRETSLTAATVRSRLALWQRNGIIKDWGDERFELICE